MTQNILNNSVTLCEVAGLIETNAEYCTCCVAAFFWGGGW